MICDICGQEITEVAYIEVGASIVIQDKDNQQPIIYTSPAQRSYYNVKLYLHDRCWIKLIGSKTDLKIDGGLKKIPVNQ